jgi:hypothetical protein
MQYDPQYLGRNLTSRVQDAVRAFQHKMMGVRSEASGAGALNSSSVYVQYWQQGKQVLMTGINDAAQFAYNLTGEHTGEVFNQVDFCSKRIVDEMMSCITINATREGAGQHVYADIVHRTRADFDELRSKLLDDFQNGMMGSGRLKKDPVVKIIANQTNSPGGVQQVGAGDFSQSAFVNNHKQLLEAIDAVLMSSEFERLESSEKDGVRDIAQAVKDEATKSQPDAGRLKRWGLRLVEFTKEVGMKTASSMIASVLAKIFTA